MRIFKHKDSVKDVKAGDIVEISPNLFIKVDEVISAFDEELFGRKKKSTYHLNGTVVELK
jgi:hypothetical protein